jgi:hypothetical protein
MLALLSSLTDAGQVTQNPELEPGVRLEEIAR